MDLGWLGKALDIVLFLVKRKKQLVISNVFSESNAIDRICEDIIDSDLSVDCFLIMLAHNGGTKLNPVAKKYYSVVGGDYNEFLMKNFEFTHYKNLPVNYEYNELLSSIYEDRRKNNGVLMATATAPDTLKIKYIYENLKFVKYHFLHYSDAGMWYLKVGTTQENEQMMDAHHRARIYFALTEIQNILKKY